MRLPEFVWSIVNCLCVEIIKDQRLQNYYQGTWKLYNLEINRHFCNHSLIILGTQIMPFSVAWDWEFLFLYTLSKHTKPIHRTLNPFWIAHFANLFKVKDSVTEATHMKCMNGHHNVLMRFQMMHGFPLKDRYHTKNSCTLLPRRTEVQLLNLVPTPHCTRKRCYL